MGRKPLTQGEWLEKYTRILCSLGDQFSDGGPVVPYGPHTVLKLTCVAFYAPMFSMIAKGWSAKSRGYDAAVYLDMFAGPGIVSVGKKEDMVGGSPIAATKTNFPFDFSVFVEIEKDRATILNKRLSTYLPRGGYLVMNGDTNVLVGDVIAEIKKRYKKPIVLAFIDPEGMEAKWKTAEALSQAFPNLDFMINVTSGAARVAGKLSNGITEVRPIFDDYFGPNAEKALTDYSSGGKVEASYADGIKTVLGKPLGQTIRICDVGNRVMYYILAYTRQSLGGSDWARGFQSLKERLNGLDGKNVESTLDVVKGRTKSLASWYGQD